MEAHALCFVPSRTIRLHPYVFLISRNEPTRYSWSRKETSRGTTLPPHSASEMAICMAQPFEEFMALEEPKFIRDGKHYLVWNVQAPTESSCIDDDWHCCLTH